MKFTIVDDEESNLYRLYIGDHHGSMVYKNVYNEFGLNQIVGFARGWASALGKHAEIGMKDGGKLQYSI